MFSDITLINNYKLRDFYCTVSDTKSLDNGA